MDYSKLVCSLCMTPYEIPEIRVETFFTDISPVDFILYNSTPIHIGVNYLSLLYGIYAGHTISTRVFLSQSTIYTLYALLYYWYVRIENTNIYLKIFLERHAYIYGLILLYSSYSAYKENYLLMSLTSMIAHSSMWKEHITILELVNDEVLKNE